MNPLKKNTLVARETTDLVLRGSTMPITNSAANSNPPPSRPLAVSGKVFRLQTQLDLTYDPLDENEIKTPYRDAVCDLCEKTVAMALGVPLNRLRARTRCNADVALARQIAMYLCHTTFSIILTEIGLHFGRDRTTVSHACALVEEKRDDLSFDVMICQLESLLSDARHAMGICLIHGQSPYEVHSVDEMDGGECNQ